ncbi:protein TonB [Sphingobium sp. B11D3B]|uniref:energy transducer TonB n=1 Tax=Sphingobium sp. B11D3B TaxID=2940575 RepID=UPI002227BA3C|nr:energy transducer TonB [Sphingobium sp. B11D3B]MCW2389784.1 protein TonB [Sphingobium sp. B11D3B]
MSLVSSQSSYAPQSGYATRRSPGALAAAIVFNGGLIGLLIALPATHYLRPAPTPPIDVRFVPTAPLPPPVTPEPDAKVETQPTRPLDTPRDPVRVDPQINLGTMTDLTTKPYPPLPDLDAGKTIVTPPAAPVIVPAQPDARFADRFRPPYPPAMQREGREGSVTVRVSIDERGRVTAVEQVRASDPAFFEAAQRHALRAWRFRPATRDGVPVASEQVLTLRFELER